MFVDQDVHSHYYSVIQLRIPKSVQYAELMSLHLGRVENNNMSHTTYMHV